MHYEEVVMTNRSGLSALLLFCSPAFTLLPAPRIAAASVDRDVVAVENVDKEFNAALVAGDLNTLGRLYADTYVFTDPAGQVSSKSDVLSGLRTGAIKVVSQVTADVRVDVYGDTAVETGRLTSKAMRNGRDSGGSFRFTRVWVRHDGAWQTVAFQETRIP